ncbi:MAG TPA: cupin domain-containing protein [Thermodesulfobacteriota bacterium]
MQDRAAELIEALRLVPHPEGGHYREVFRSADLVEHRDGRGARSALTTIYYLLRAGERSRWHRVASDEVWHLYEGDGLELWLAAPDGSALTHVRLGRASPRETPVQVVPAGIWQAARPLGDYALVGCTVGPGFEFADFTLLADDPESRARLCARWPDAAALV